MHTAKENCTFSLTLLTSEKEKVVKKGRNDRAGKTLQKKKGQMGGGMGTWKRVKGT